MSDNTTALAGVDLAWKTDGNATAVARGRLSGDVLFVDLVYTELRSVEAVLAALMHNPPLEGIAVDASLIIPNDHGRRRCEGELTREYGRRKAGCHPTNRTLYPDSGGEKISRALGDAGYGHLGRPPEKWQIECYPHPAIIEIFGLPERLAYKKGTAAARRAGQITLARLITSLASSPVLPLRISSEWAHLLHPRRIAELRGTALKRNEDALDAIICLYIAGLYRMETAAGIQNRAATVFGDIHEGYIYVPRQNCLTRTS